MDCCDEAGCADQAFRELTDEEILALDFDPDFDRFLVDLQRQVRSRITWSRRVLARTCVQPNV